MILLWLNAYCDWILIVLALTPVIELSADKVSIMIQRQVLAAYVWTQFLIYTFKTWCSVYLYCSFLFLFLIHTVPYVDWMSQMQSSSFAMKILLHILVQRGFWSNVLSVWPCIFKFDQTGICCKWTNFFEIKLLGSINLHYCVVKNWGAVPRKIAIYSFKLRSIFGDYVCPRPRRVLFFTNTHFNFIQDVFRSFSWNIQRKRFHCKIT